MDEDIESDELERVPAWSVWEWDCPRCGDTWTTSFAPPEIEVCEDCNIAVMTEAR